jgi:hypothetical protein
VKDSTSCHFSNILLFRGVDLADNHPIFNILLQLEGRAPPLLQILYFLIEIRLFFDLPALKRSPFIDCGTFQFHSTGIKYLSIFEMNGVFSAQGLGEMQAAFEFKHSRDGSDFVFPGFPSEAIEAAVLRVQLLLLRMLALLV